MWHVLVRTREVEEVTAAEIIVEVEVEAEVETEEAKAVAIGPGASQEGVERELGDTLEVHRVDMLDTEREDTPDREAQKIVTVLSEDVMIDTKTALAGLGSLMETDLVGMKLLVGTGSVDGMDLVEEMDSPVGMGMVRYTGNKHFKL